MIVHLPRGRGRAGPRGAGLVRLDGRVHDRGRSRTARSGTHVGRAVRPGAGRARPRALAERFADRGYFPVDPTTRCPPRLDARRACASRSRRAALPGAAPCGSPASPRSTRVVVRRELLLDPGDLFRRERVIKSTRAPVRDRAVHTRPSSSRRASTRRAGRSTSTPACASASRATSRAASAPGTYEKVRLSARVGRPQPRAARAARSRRTGASATTEGHGEPVSARARHSPTASRGCSGCARGPRRPLLRARVRAAPGRTYPQRRTCCPSGWPATHVLQVAAVAHAGQHLDNRVRASSGRRTRPTRRSSSRPT